jgi:polyribonucleotide nucleotidyltransferase
MIKKIIEETKAQIDIEDDGSVFIASSSGEAAQKAIDMIRGLTAEVEVGQTYNGTVRRILDFGAFVEVLPGKDGLVHISQLAPHRVERVEDVVSVGDRLEVKVTGIDSMGRINLSHRAVLEPNGGDSESDQNRGGRDRGPRPGGGGPRPDGGFRRGEGRGERRYDGGERRGGPRGEGGHHRGDRGFRDRGEYRGDRGDRREGHRDREPQE